MKSQLSARLVQFISLLLFVSLAAQVQAISTEALKQGIPSLAPMLEEVIPAVVSIRVSKSRSVTGRFLYNGEQLPESVRRYFKDLPDVGREGYEQRPYATGAGSGVIVNAQEGLIITNHHVVDGATTITVQLSDGRTSQAKLLGADAGTDVALLQIEAEDLVGIGFADIGSVDVGDYVVAIGNPFGIGQTVTSGIVSALGRAGINNEKYEDFIQTDAAINLGNSGGALVDMEGNLIGINTAIISGNGGSNGIGFAVPADMVLTVMEHLQRDGEVRRGLLGVTIANATPDIVAALDADVESGAVVTSVQPGSAAEQAGIEISDIIVELDGEPVNGSRELRNMVGLMLQDQQVDLVLYRDGERERVRATIGGVTGQASQADRPQSLSSKFRGAQLQPLLSDNSTGEQGVEVTAVEQRSSAWVSGLRAGDLIIEVNRRPVTNLADFNALVDSAGRMAALTVLREGRRLLFYLT